MGAAAATEVTAHQRYIYDEHLHEKHARIAPQLHSQGRKHRRPLVHHALQVFMRPISLCMNHLSRDRGSL